MDDRAETGLALDDGVGDTHLLAEGGEEDDELDGVDIVGDEDERSLLVLNEADDVVETVLDGVGLLADVLLLLALLDGGGLLQETLLLLGLGLRAVLVEELEGLGGGVAVEDVLELGERRGNLEAHRQDLLLALKADILGPLHHARKVAAGLDVLANAEVAGALLNERVLQDLVSGRASRSTPGMRRVYTPWDPSWSQRCACRTARPRPSFQSWGAVIEKRKDISEMFFDIVCLPFSSNEAPVVTFLLPWRLQPIFTLSHRSGSQAGGINRIVQLSRPGRAYCNGQKPAADDDSLVAYHCE